jgi:hypothetical protein
MKPRSFKQWLGVGALALGATIVQFSSVSPAIAGVPEAIATAVSQVHNEQLSAYVQDENRSRASAN